MDYKLEVVLIPVKDVDRSVRFYTEGCGFRLDVDYHPSETFRVVQLTPPGSACSIQIGLGLSDAAPGTSHKVCLAVNNIAAARQELIQRGVNVEPLRHKSSIDDWSGDTQDGLDPQRRDYATFASFTDPDGNTWDLQEIGFTAGPADKR